ncbi:peptidase, m20 family [Cystobacter fuscus DSM 2262]|uniref:Peptidase, m20 family n=1 Tax=Cystobacter fuscus (strain ATCC 25194 / DSM 2262 / NBRC 100088 / M29) TaxID=1242864 RepID=S9R2Z3_CYSF2|nr:peptidase, m20 family [Cystobacter fuscus DSM 2262]
MASLEAFAVYRLAEMIRNDVELQISELTYAILKHSSQALHVRPAFGGAQVFRARGWPGPLLIAGAIKEALGRAGITGVMFEGG